MLVAKNVSLRPDQYERLQKIGSREGNRVIRDALDFYFATRLSVCTDRQITDGSGMETQAVMSQAEEEV